MIIFYKKNNNEKLFKTLENILDLKNNQNYIPIYNAFFDLNYTNYNSINLDNCSNIININEKINYSKFLGEIKNNDKIVSKKIFCKFSPIIDPCKYVLGKFDVNMNLPNLNYYIDNSNISYSDTSYSDISYDYIVNDINNSSYCDAFFSFLSSKLLHNYNFLNAIDFYGSFIGMKQDFNFDISEELEYLDDCDFFKDNLNKKFKLANSEIEKQIINNTKKNKSKIKIDKSDNISLDFEEISINEENMDQNIHNNSTEILEISDEYNVKNFIDLSDNEENKLEKKSKKDNSSSLSSSNTSCSSRFSETDDDSDISDNEEDNNETSHSDNSSETSNSEIEEEICIIKEFPVQSILLECCDDTLDNYIKNNKIKDAEWESIVLQILFTLITYQKCYSFTHNDLHTNNIVYNKTDKVYLYYKYNNKHYKVPTFNKIYKIIDFGRAIFRFNNHTFFNNSYSKIGDAYSQYNCEPYFNELKPRVDPNYSFDLARLGCSLFDYFVDDLDEILKLKSKIKKIIISWVFDDNNKNILYKNDGSERYPDFKLYKMIARTVHKHTPSKVLDNVLFEKYTLNKKKINKSAHIFNIDELKNF